MKKSDQTGLEGVPGILKLPIHPDNTSGSYNPCML
jgi:hypothetical protein